MIVVIDFGGQTAHLITRRLRELNSPAALVTPEDALSYIDFHKPQGIILSGGPASVYEKNAPTIDPKIFSLNIPTLDICYGLQLRAYLLGGKVVSGTKEYGPAKIRLKIKDLRLKIIEGLPEEFTVWMSHGDSVLSIPKGFETVGSTDTVPYAFIVDEKTHQYGLQFHPEVEHTENGMKILANFLKICQQNYESRIKNQGEKNHDSYFMIHDSSRNPQQMIEKIKEKVGKSHVIGAVSGGVDSTVAATLVAKAIGKQFTPIFVDNGLMREDAVLSVKNLFKRFDIEPITIEVRKEMLERLKGITDSEKKRKIIGEFYVELFEKEMEKILTGSQSIVHSSQKKRSGSTMNHELTNHEQFNQKVFLLQGTIYSDVIESQGTKHASKIKSHHNVGGLPEDMKFQLLEPLRELYKDEVRTLGQELGLPLEFIHKQPFPGPGFAVRIRGEVTEKRLEQEKQADKIVLEELKKAGWLDKVFISFPVMTDAYSTAVKGDGRFFGEVIALRVVESKDIMTSTWARLPYDVLQKISSRIVNEVPEISRVVYDISTKPPATMEWE